MKLSTKKSKNPAKRKKSGKKSFVGQGVAKGAKLIIPDSRGRITLPKSIRNKVSSYTIHGQEDGVIQLIPRISVSLQDAQVLSMLKHSIQQYATGEVEDVPDEWIE